MYLRQVPGLTLTFTLYLNEIIIYPMYFYSPAVSAGVTLHFYLLSSTCMAVVKIHTIDRQKDLHQTFHPTLYNFKFLRYC